MKWWSRGNATRLLHTQSSVPIGWTNTTSELRNARSRSSFDAKWKQRRKYYATGHTSQQRFNTEQRETRTRSQLFWRTQAALRSWPGVSFTLHSMVMALMVSLNLHQLSMLSVPQLADQTNWNALVCKTQWKPERTQNPECAGPSRFRFWDVPHITVPVVEKSHQIRAERRYTSLLPGITTTDRHTDTSLCKHSLVLRSHLVGPHSSTCSD